MPQNLTRTRWPFWENGRVIVEKLLEINDNQITKYVYSPTASFIMCVKCWLKCSQKQQPMTSHLFFFSYCISSVGLHAFTANLHLQFGVIVLQTDKKHIIYLYLCCCFLWNFSILACLDGNIGDIFQWWLKVSVVHYWLTKWHRGRRKDLLTSRYMIKLIIK